MFHFSIFYLWGKLWDDFAKSTIFVQSWICKLVSLEHSWIRVSEMLCSFPVGLTPGFLRTCSDVGELCCHLRTAPSQRIEMSSFLLFQPWMSVESLGQQSVWNSLCLPRWNHQHGMQVCLLILLHPSRRILLGQLWTWLLHIFLAHFWLDCTTVMKHHSARIHTFQDAIPFLLCRLLLEVSQICLSISWPWRNAVLTSIEYSTQFFWANMDKLIFSDSFAHVGESFGMSSFPISSKPLTTSLAFVFTPSFVSLSVQTHLVETQLCPMSSVSVYTWFFPAFKFFFL